MFRQLRLHNWRQFADIDISFHSRLTILTGANGAGKTTLLHLLNRHWGWNVQFVSTPRFTSKGVREYWAGFWEDERDSTRAVSQVPSEETQIGIIEYSDGTIAQILVPRLVTEIFAVKIRDMKRLNGVYVPSHRPLYVFQKVENIPTALDAKEQIFQTYLQELQQRFTATHKVQSPSFRIKSALISLATFGYGNEAVERNEDAIRTFEGFERILRIVLPSTLGFRTLKIRVPDVILVSDTGDFAFDAVSGGVAALIDVSWQIYMYSLLHDGFVVAIDEPEAHLHPALQQRLLPDLLNAFPSTQFIVATHNPFVIASVPESNVYVLDYDADQKVHSTLLDLVNKAGSANEILRDVLGVPQTIPLWVSDRLQSIVEDFSAEEFTEASLARLRTSMGEIGLAHVFPQALTRVLEARK